MTDHDDTRVRCRPRGPGSPGPPGRPRRACPRPDQRGRGSARRSTPTAGSVSATCEPRWVLPVAATHARRPRSHVAERATGARAARCAGCARCVREPSGALRPGAQPEDVVQPVLPPQAYWGMDPFREFATLRPGTQEHRNAGAQEPGYAGQIRRRARPQASPTACRRRGLAQAVGFATHRLESIAPAPLVVAPVAPLEDIALADDSARRPS